MSLRTKFNVVMAGAFALSLALTWIIGTRISDRHARREVLAQAAVMMGAANATIHYTDTQITPLLDSKMQVLFLPQGVPFFAARRTFETLQAAFPGYGFREAAVNPTNPEDRATPWEAGIIEQFRTHPDLKSVVVDRPTPDGSTLYYAEPIRVSDKSCLACHTTPDMAPASMVDVYGPENGFGWKLGQLIGATMVSVPETVAVAKARQDRSLTLAAIAALFAGMILMLNVFLHFIVVAPVRRIAKSADEISLGNMEAAELNLSSHDEIGSLSRSFNRMRRSLAAAMLMLEA